jgi:hypothetical protein
MPTGALAGLFASSRAESVQVLATLANLAKRLHPSVVQLRRLVLPLTARLMEVWAGPLGYSKVCTGFPPGPARARVRAERGSALAERAEQHCAGARGVVADRRYALAARD